MTFAVTANEKGEKVLTMSKEYIEREKLLQDIEHYHLSDGKFQHWVEIQPAADVAPVVHGRWIEQEKYTFGVMYDCSICDNLILDNGHSWNYCPNCGCKMDLE